MKATISVDHRPEKTQSFFIKSFFFFKPHPKNGITQQSTNAHLTHRAKQVGGLPFLHYLIAFDLANEVTANFKILAGGSRTHKITGVFAGGNKTNADHITFADDMGKFHVHITKGRFHTFHEINILLFIEMHPVAGIGKIIGQGSHSTYPILH